MARDLQGAVTGVRVELCTRLVDRFFLLANVDRLLQTLKGAKSVIGYPTNVRLNPRAVIIFLMVASSEVVPIAPSITQVERMLNDLHRVCGSAGLQPYVSDVHLKTF